MSFFDKLSTNMTNAGRIASQKVKNMSEANTLSTEQRNEKASIQRNFSEIGKLYYEKYKDAPDAEFAELVAAILASEKRIAEIDEEIEAVRAREPELIPIPEDEAAAQAQSKVCMQCGATYPVTETKCAACGHDLVAQYAYGAPAPANNAPEAKPEPVEPVTVPLVNPAPKPAMVNGVAAAPSQAAPEPAAPAASEAPAEPKAPAAPEAPAAPVDPVNAPPRFCAYCGKPCEPDQRFCAHCGKQL